MAQKLLPWKVNTPQLLEEILTNKECWILQKPLTIFKGILVQLSQRAIELDDLELHAIMIRLGLYEICNPRSTEFNQKKSNAVINAAAKARKKRLSQTKANKNELTTKA